MGKLSIRSKRKQGANPAQSVYDRHKASWVGLEENPEVRAVQHPSAGGLSAPLSPSTLNTNLSAFGESFVCAPAFCHNTVGRDVNMVFITKDVVVTQTTESVVSENRPVAQEALTDIDTISKTILRTPKKFKKKSHNIFSQNRSKCRHSSRRNITCSRLDFEDVKDLLALDKGKHVVLRPGGHKLTSVTGEIAGTRVTADYHCYECGAAIHRFKAKAFRVKCTKCDHSWKCAKVQCMCTAEITIELPRGEKQTVVLSDSLLRSIVRFDTEGYCNTDKIEKKVLKVGNIRVDFVDGDPNKVTVS